MFRSLFRAALVLTTAGSIGAQQQKPPAAAAPLPQPDPLHQVGRNVTVYLLTMGNGTQIWELFGHNAIWIHDNVTNRDTVFNWGVFSFRQPHFIARFLKGKMLYSMGGDSMENILLEYQYWNRSVVAQELDLLPAQRDTILAAIRSNALPENVDYRYDYFRDNCSTRVRDLIDRALGGTIAVQARGLTGTTYRWHTLRLMQSDVPIVVGVDIGLGRPADMDLTKWQEMFLPRKLHDFVAKVRVTDSAGTTHPLVRSERVLFQANRGPEAESPPELGVWLLLGGVVVASLIIWAGLAASSGSRLARGAVATVAAIWSLLAGLLGAILTLLWSVTDHVFAHANENLLLFNPVWLVMVVLLPLYLWSGRAERFTRSLIALLMVSAVAALAAHATGLSAQQNLPVIGLALPPVLAIAAIAVRRRVIARRVSTANGRQRERGKPGVASGRVAAGGR
ncbi:MAG TPA: DUF4105 domain-containing protein [Gemmatimonadaceae bacterium]|nr:DUF4105 domain-containing protein [Gemmatimonadaceae bacterium]